MASQIQRFQPGNHTVGCAFVAAWCGSCARGKPAPCGIAVRTTWYTKDDPDYPDEWQYKNGVPVCAAHIPEGEPVPERCAKTRDMFGEARS